MQLNSFSITNKAVIFAITLNPDSDDEINAQEDRTVTCKEEPLPELKDAFAKLPKIFCEIMGWPSDYATGIIVTRLEISRTKHGTRAVRIKGRKPLDTIGGEPHPISAPMVKLDKPGDGESGEVLISKEAVKRLNAAVMQAERYAAGERSQQLINFEQAKAGINAVANQGRDMFAEASNS